MVGCCGRGGRAVLRTAAVGERAEDDRVAVQKKSQEVIEELSKQNAKLAHENERVAAPNEQQHRELAAFRANNALNRSRRSMSDGADGGRASGQAVLGTDDPGIT